MLAAQSEQSSRSSRRRSFSTGFGLGILLAVAAYVPVQAADAPTVGTWFDGLGSPYGGCGVPQDLLETQYFVALNVYNTPGQYSNSPARPLTGGDLASMGEFANGANCGRWVEVTLAQYCQGTNDGAPGQPFCRGAGASWIDDSYSGATLDMLVADSCGDGNAWCRDSKLHLDLSKISLDHFSKGGTVLTGLNPDHWNNRGLAWKYIPAPNYTGDIKIFFLKGAMKNWPAIMINNLPNGIHVVEQWVGNVWKKADRFSDMGQGFILTPADSFRIHVFAADDKLLQNGREYTFAIPSSCGGTCSAAATATDYQAANAGTAIHSSSMTSDFKCHVHLLAESLRLEFPSPKMEATQPNSLVPGSSAWRVIAADLQGRIAASAQADCRGEGTCSTSLARPKSGLYAIEVLSGNRKIFISRVMVP